MRWLLRSPERPAATSTIGADIAAVTSDTTTDVFGVSGHERLLRRLVAAAIATWVVPPVAFLALPIAYLGALPSSYVLERYRPGRRGGPTFVRYALLGAAFALVAVLVLQRTQGDLGVWGLAGISIGALAGGVGAWAATALPDRWVLPAAVTASVFTLAMLVAVLTAGVPAFLG